MVAADKIDRAPVLVADGREVDISAHHHNAATATAGDRNRARDYEDDDDDAGREIVIDAADRVGKRAPHVMLGLRPAINRRVRGSLLQLAARTYD